MARNVSDMYYTLNGSYFNRSDDEHDHHSASYKLYRFLPKLSFYWAIAGSLFFLVVSCLLYTYFSSKGTSPEETAETVKKTHRDRKFGTFVSWFYFASNSMILWMDIVAVVYCYGGFVRNCPPISDEDFSYAFFLGALCPYVVILICVCDVAKDIVGRENISNADLHDALVNLIHREEPVVMWTAKENDDDPYPVATEENSFKFEKWKTSIWKEGIFGLHQVSPEVAIDSVFTTMGHPRFTITTYVCTGDQVVMVFFCVLSFLLGLAVPYQMVVFFLLPVEHYILYKTVYSDGDEEPTPIESRDSVELRTLTGESRTSDTLSCKLWLQRGIPSSLLKGNLQVCF